MASSQNKFTLPNLPIAVNLSKYKKKYYVHYARVKKVPHNSFYKDKWFLLEWLGKNTEFALQAPGKT